MINRHLPGSGSQWQPTFPKRHSPVHNPILSGGNLLLMFKYYLTSLGTLYVRSGMVVFRFYQRPLSLGIRRVYMWLTLGLGLVWKRQGTVTDWDLSYHQRGV